MKKCTAVKHILLNPSDSFCECARGEPRTSSQSSTIVINQDQNLKSPIKVTKRKHGEDLLLLTSKKNICF